jgi:hypothetical protein
MTMPTCAWLAPADLAPCARPAAYAVELTTAAGAPLPLHACAGHVGALVQRGFRHPHIARATITRTAVPTGEAA